MPAVLELDGSYGEGGGQLLRSAVALSCLTGSPIRVFNVRGKRPKPGLQPQHMTALKAAAEVSGALVQGLSIGSTEVYFEPKEIKAGRYLFDIKTAGSVTLVMQTLLPILSFAKGTSEVTIIGGTDVPWSPTVDYFRYVAIDAFRSMGLDCAVELLRRGHYPRGGGRVVFAVRPAKPLSPIVAVKRGRVLAVRGISHCTSLPAHVASRQASSAVRIIRETGLGDVRIAEERGEGDGPGSGVALWAEVESGPNIGADALGAREKRAEEVGREAAEKLLAELKTGMAVDRHLGDMLIIYMAMARGRSEIGVTELTMHAETMIWLTERFLGLKWLVERGPGGSATLRVDGAGIH
ncbi:MAG: RNA 3'-terminal phosphate cyclase [Candidatus Methanomethylicaceae archaeon]